MKKIFIITAALALSLSTSDVLARKGLDAMITVNANVGNNGFPHFDPVVGGGKGTAINENYRLIAKTYSRHNGTALLIFDSTTYNYNNGRGGLIDVNNPNDDQDILFDNSFTYRYNAQTFSYVNRMHRQQSFSNSNKIASLTYKPWQYTVSNGWIFKDSVRYLYNYRADGKMEKSTSSVWVGNIWTNDVSSTITYNNNGIASMTSDAGYKVTFTYDANNNIQTITDKKWNGSYLENFERKSYTYIGTEIATYELEVWDNIANVWVKTSKWEYSYIAGSTRLDTVIESKFVNGNWELFSKTTHLYDVNNDLTSETVALWNAVSQQYVDSKRERWEYNISGHPNLYVTETWSTSLGWHQASNDEQIRYYYQHYFPTSVYTVANTQDLNVYPIPATSTINIDWDNHPDYSVAVVDMMGKVVYNKANVSGSQQLSIQNLPNGNYFVKVYDDESQLSKQVIVAH